MVFEDDVEMTINIRVKKRWIPHVVGMLEHMQRLGTMGSSRWVHFFSDGDGDFRPKFSFDHVIQAAKPVKINEKDELEVYFDAG